MSIFDTLLGSLNGIALLDSLVGNATLLEDLAEDLGGNLGDVTGALNLSEERLSDLLATLTGGSDIGAIAAPLQAIIDTLETLVPQLSGIDTAPVNALEEALGELIDDFGTLSDAVNSGLTPEDAIAALAPILDDFAALTAPLENTLGGDGLFGNQLDDLVNNTPLLEDLVSDLGDTADDVGQSLEPVLTDLESLLNGLPDTLSSPENVANELTGLAEDLQSVIDSLAGNPSSAVNELVDALQDLANDLGVIASDITDGNVPAVQQLIDLINPAVDDLQTLTGTLNPGGATDPNQNMFNGTDSSDTAITTAKQDMFDMKGGKDTVTSALGHLEQVDAIHGGNGVDTLILKGGTVKDTLKLRVATDRKPENVRSGLPEGSVVTGFEVFDTRTFAGRAIVVGNSADDLMMGGKGADKFVGKNGDDRLEGGKGRGKDKLLGGSGNDQLWGGKGDDLLNGGAGNDMMYSGHGKDKLKTGDGKDTIVFESVKQRGDRIKDFDGKQDILAVSRAGFSKSLKKGKLKDSQFVLGREAESRGACFIYDSDKGALSFDADGTGKGKSVLVASFSNGASLTASDIVII